MARESSHRLLLKLASSLLYLHMNYHHFIIVPMFVIITITVPFIFGIQSFIYTSICYGNNCVNMHLKIKILLPSTFLLQARELKSIHLDFEGNFIKLVLHKNHVNKYNIYNQAS